MEFIEGETLEDIRGAYTHFPARLYVALELAIYALWHHKILHTDLNRNNIIWTKRSIKIIDFGRAISIEDDRLWEPFRRSLQPRNLVRDNGAQLFLFQIFEQYGQGLEKKASNIYKVARGTNLYRSDKDILKYVYNKVMKEEHDALYVMRYDIYRKCKSGILSSPMSFKSLTEKAAYMMKRAKTRTNMWKRKLYGRGYAKTKRSEIMARRRHGVYKRLRYAAGIASSAAAGGGSSLFGKLRLRSPKPGGASTGFRQRLYGPAWRSDGRRYEDGNNNNYYYGDGIGRGRVRRPLQNMNTNASSSSSSSSFSRKLGENNAFVASPSGRINQLVLNGNTHPPQNQQQPMAPPVSPAVNHDELRDKLEKQLIDKRMLENDQQYTQTYFILLPTSMQENLYTNMKTSDWVTNLQTYLETQLSTEGGWFRGEPVKSKVIILQFPNTNTTKNIITLSEELFTHFPANIYVWKRRQRKNDTEGNSESLSRAYIELAGIPTQYTAIQNLLEEKLKKF
jgi:predicted Ser/Thr protein kinase